MDSETSRKLYPKSVLTMYLKLYCSRRDTNKNKMMEGIKSWLSLSKSEKKYFFNKYKYCQMQYKNKMAKLLRNAQPFMKRKKITKRLIENETAKAEYIMSEPEHRALDNQSHNVIESADIIHDVSEMFIDDIPCGDEICSPEEPNDHIENTYRKEQNIVEQLAEPTAPSIRTAKELFEMLNTDNNQNSTTWASLSSTQKSRYQRAMILLKNDYITKYKAYLESLPPKKLFEYYNAFFK